MKLVTTFVTIVVVLAILVIVPGISSAVGIAFVDYTEAFYTTGGAKTISISPTAGSVLIVTIHSDVQLPATDSTVSDNRGDSFTQCRDVEQAPVFFESFCTWSVDGRAFPVVGGTTVVTVTLNHGAIDYQVVIVEYANVASRYPLPGCDATATTATPVTLTSGISATCPLWANNAYVVAFAMHTGSTLGCNIETTIGTKRFESQHTVQQQCLLWQDNRPATVIPGQVKNQVSNSNAMNVYFQAFGLAPTDSLAITGSWVKSTSSCGSSLTMVEDEIADGGERVLLFVHIEDSGTDWGATPTPVSTVTDGGGNTWEKVGVTSVGPDPDDFFAIELWQTSAESGLSTITVTLAAAECIDLWAITLVQAEKLRSVVADSGSGVTRSLTSRTVNRNEWVLGIFSVSTQDGTTSSVNGNFYEKRCISSTSCVTQGAGFAGLGNAATKTNSAIGIGFTYSTVGPWAGLLTGVGGPGESGGSIDFIISAFYLAVFFLILALILVAAWAFRNRRRGE